MDELTAAGITDPDLRASYEECKRLNALHGKTYYLATLLLPKAKRPFVHALYGFARYADEIVDDLASELSVEEKAEVLSNWGNGVLADLKKGTSQDHVGRALIDTVNRFDIPHEHFEAFLHSMTMDLTVQEYESYEDLLEYVYGSAAVIGLEMVPILGPLHNDAFEAAKKLGKKKSTLARELMEAKMYDLKLMQNELMKLLENLHFQTNEERPQLIALSTHKNTLVFCPPLCNVA